MSDIIEKNKPLEIKILEAQEKLKKIDPRNNLLNLVTVDDTEIVYTADFSTLYWSMIPNEALGQYVVDLKTAYDENFIQSLKP